MKFRNQARLCLAIYDFEARIMLSLCLNFQCAGLSVWEKFIYSELQSVNLISDFY